MISIKLSIFRQLVWKTWLKAFIVATLALFLLFSVGDLTVGFLRRSVSSWEVFVNYFLFLPFAFSKIIPSSSLLATLFFLHTMRGSSELVAIFSSGLSRRKFTRLIVEIASIIMVFQFINIYYLDPLSKQIHKKIIVNGGKKFSLTKSRSLLKSVISGGKIWYRSEGYYISYSAYDKSRKVLIQPTFFYFNENNENTKIIKAEKATGNNKREWVLSKAQIMENITTKTFPRLKDKHIFQLFLLETSDDFDRIDNDLNTLNPIALFKFVSQIKKSGILANEYEIFFLEKIANSVACLFFALLPIGIIFSPHQKNTSLGKSLLFSIIFTLGYWGIHSVFVTLGNSATIPPLLAAFGTLLLLTLYFLYFLATKRRF